MDEATLNTRSLPDLLRERTALVAGAARHVRVVPERVASYAVEVATDVGLRRTSSEPERPAPDPCTGAAFWLTLDAVNFGSGWFPTLRKHGGRTGYRTIAAGITRRFETNGPWSAAELMSITEPELGELLDEDPGHELIGLFCRSLRDLGAHLEAEHRGSFGTLVASAEGSAVRLVERLATWECFADTSTYDGLELPFLKRAQIAAADLHRTGAAHFADIDRLTMFADNLVPHVLRLDGVLSFAPDLVARIEREELIEHGSPEEVEIRACAVHAVELLVAAAPVPITAVEVDECLWNRGQRRAYKAHPRHRSRSTAY